MPIKIKNNNKYYPNKALILLVKNLLITLNSNFSQRNIKKYLEKLNSQLINNDPEEIHLIDEFENKVDKITNLKSY